jgi:plastocyanin
MTRSAIRTRLAATAAVAVLGLGVAACGSSSSPSSSSATTTSGAATPGTSAPGKAPATTAAVKIQNFQFVPQTITVKVGGTVTWTNLDTVGHSVESNTGAWTTSKVLNKGQTFSHTFTKAGTFPYICGVHNYMTGTVKVEG